MVSGLSFTLESFSFLCIPLFFRIFSNFFLFSIGDGEVNDDNRRHVTANNMSESAFLTYSILEGNRKYATQHPTTIT